MECLYCAAALSREQAAEHYARLHRERLEAAAEYRRLVTSGKPVEVARAAVNEMLKAALDFGPGKYMR